MTVYLVINSSGKVVRVFPEEVVAEDWAIANKNEDIYFVIKGWQP